MSRMRLPFGRNDRKAGPISGANELLPIEVVSPLTMTSEEVQRAVNEVREHRLTANLPAAHMGAREIRRHAQQLNTHEVTVYRWMGQWLSHHMAPGRPKASADASQLQQTKLSDLGVSPSQSSRWQKLGALSDAEFEKAVTALKQQDTTISVGSVLRISAPKKVSGSAQKSEPAKRTPAITEALPSYRYACKCQEVIAPSNDLVAQCGQICKETFRLSETR